MVTVIQRFDSALRLNVHFHTLVLDGVYVKTENSEGLRLPRPSEDDVYEVARRTAKKVQAELANRGRTSDCESKGDVASEIEPALGACYEFALAFAGAYGYVCPRHRRDTHYRASTDR